jgi:YesN/AraC family two-component response regulator
MKLLIADDQESLHIFLDRTMNWEALGITDVRHAYDGKETLRLAEQFAPDLLILDIRMPFMTGLEALKSLQECSRKPKTIILSAHDEFEYARDALQLNAVQYLLKPVDISLMEAAVRSLVSDIRKEREASLTHAFGRLVHSRVFEPGSLQAIGEAFQALQIRRYAVLDVYGESGSESLMKAWISEGGSGGPADSEATVRPVIYRKSPNGYSCLLGLTAELPEPESSLLELARRVSARWTASFPEARVSIGVSRTAADPSLLLDLIGESEEANLLNFYAPENVSMYTEGCFSQDWCVSDFQKYKNAFKEKVALEFRQQALIQLVAELFRDFRQKRIHPDNVYALALHYLYTIGQAMNRTGMKNAFLDGISLDTLRQSRHIAELEAAFTAMIRQLAEAMEEAPGLSETVMKVREYVQLHYGEDLSLHTVSQLFAIDRFQLSRAFKQQFNVNYWTYVTQVRMEKAAEMLTGTDLKNSVIAAATGFVDESHFSRAFKKYYGMTPREFRQSKGGPSAVIPLA